MDLFLNPQDVDDCFTDDLISILPQDKRVQCFVDNMLENDIPGRSHYPSAMWVSFTCTLARTNITVVSLSIPNLMLRFIQPYY